MIPPRKPDNEAARMAALRAYAILDTPPEAAYDDLLTIAAGICETPMGAMSLIDGERQWFKARLGVDAEETPRDVSFCGHAILDPENVLVVENAVDDPRFVHNPLVLDDPSIRFYAGAPLLAPGGEAIGTLCVFDSKPHALSAEQLAAMRALSRQVTRMLELHRATRALRHHASERDWYEHQMQQYQAELETRNADLTELSRTDALTGLPNRRAFDAALHAALDGLTDTLPSRGPSVALVDIDHFKTINDLHGHPTGDRVLADVAAVLRASAGPLTMVARYGGEEFAVLLPGVDGLAAELQGEYLRESVQNLPIGFPVSVSIGIASRAPGEDASALVKRADQALYAAKRGGRNRVVVAD